jgi:predicted flavoprotein YhiN
MAPSKDEKMSQKAEYLKNLNFVGQKIAISGVLIVNFTVRDSFFQSFIIFSCSLYI